MRRFAEPAAVPDAPARAAERVTVATYNIHKFVSNDGRRDPGRTFAVLRELDADILGLQEFEARSRARGSAVTIADLERETGMTALAHPTRRSQRGYSGNLILTRFPTSEVARHDIGANEVEPRGLMVADLAVPGGTLRTAVTHLALWPPARMRQAGLLAAHLEEPADGALVLMGDLNEWLPAGGIRDALAESYGPHPSPPTFPAIRPVAGFDQVWVSPRRCLVRLEVHQSRLARVASDHLPVRAIVDLSLRTAAASSAA